jgi:hypothetical protein
VRAGPVRQGIRHAFKRYPEIPTRQLPVKLATCGQTRRVRFHVLCPWPQTIRTTTVHALIVVGLCELGGLANDDYAAVWTVRDKVPHRHQIWHDDLKAEDDDR